MPPDSNLTVSRTKVLFLTAFPSAGGPLSKLTPLLTDGLRGQGFDVEIGGWSAHHAGHESLVAKVIGRLHDLFRVRRRIRKWRPDVVYVATTHSWMALARDVPLMIALSRGGPPLVFHFHGSQSGYLVTRGHYLFKVCSGFLVRRAAAVMLLSEEEREQWRRFCPMVRYEVVLNPFVPTVADVDVAFVSHASASQGPTLLIAARLIAEKGVFDLLEAVTVVRRRQPCRLLIAGSGPARNEIARRVQQMDINDSVELLGHLNGIDLVRVFRMADIFVLPSYHDEGFPLSVMEAMGYGLPVITTPIRGCADHLKEGVHALFVPPRRPDVLAAAIERLWADNALRARMSTANRAKVAEFSPDVVIPQYAHILRSVVNSRDEGIRQRVGSVL